MKRLADTEYEVTVEHEADDLDEAVVGMLEEINRLDDYQHCFLPLASVHYWDTDIRHLGQSMNVTRGLMSAVPSMAVAPEPQFDTGSFVPGRDVTTSGPSRRLGRARGI